MPMRMIRRPRVKRRIIPGVLKEVELSYKLLGTAVIAELYEEILDWDHKPQFKYEVKVTKKSWRLTVKYDRRRKESKIYDWVSAGTGERGVGGGKAYNIYPRKKQALIFPLPMQIKSIPNPPAFAPSFFADEKLVVTRKVRAPGIFPRRLGKDVYARLRSEKSGSFRNVTEAAIKRAFRREGIYVG